MNRPADGTRERTQGGALLSQVAGKASKTSAFSSHPKFPGGREWVGNGLDFPPRKTLIAEHTKLIGSWISCKIDRLTLRPTLTRAF